MPIASLANEPRRIPGSVPDPADDAPQEPSSPGQDQDNDELPGKPQPDPV
ncbi:hypothetical protein [Phytopseudomonas dryadis]|nr:MULTISPECIES: hypothetical protein [Pseudomonas]